MKENINPLVSVLMTAYNRERYISEAIESVVNSSYQHWELIIVDDCSRDRTVEIARTYEAKDNRIKVYENEKNLGDYPNRNQAASYAKGKYLKYLDSDDIIYPHGLEVMVNAMEQFPEAGIGLPETGYIMPRPYPFIRNSRLTFIFHFNGANFFNYGPSATIYNSEIFRLIGGYDDYSVASDFAFHMKATIQKSVVFLPRDLIWWRSHESQEIKLKKTDYIHQYFRAINEYVSLRNDVLNQKEKRNIIRNTKKINAVKALKNFVCLDFQSFLLIHKNFQLGPRDYLNIFIKNTKIEVFTKSVF